MDVVPSHAHDAEVMARAIQLAAGVRRSTSPNPWVGCVLRTIDGRWFEGATEPPGGRHAERVALDAARQAGAETVGATVWCTLEPCSHHGRTPPCTDALVAAGVSRVVAAITDPDARVAGRGIEQLLAAGLDVTVGVRGDEVTEQLRPYLHHRRTGRPFVVLKMASTLDGRTSAADGSSQWITGEAARAEVHRLRADSDAVVVGAGTVRADDPALTVRLVEGPDPLRVVLGTAPATARVHPCLQWQGPVGDLFDQLGSDGVVQVLVEGGARVAADLHRAGLVDRYVMHLAPAFMGGDDGAAVFAGRGAATISQRWQGHVRAVRMLGDDIEIVVDAHER